MFERMLLLKSFDEVKKFSAFAAGKDYDIELVSGKYVINAKSIMGIFSLDLTKPVKMMAHSDKVAELTRQTDEFSYESKEKSR